MINHVYLKYAMALLMEENNLSEEKDLKFEHIRKEINKGLNAFSVKPKESFIGKSEIKFEFVNEQNKASEYIYLSPNAITSDTNAKDLYKTAKSIGEMSDLNLGKKENVKQSQIPTVGEFCSFSDTGNIGRGHAKDTNFKICLGLITSITPLKPCLQYIYRWNGKVSTDNVCLIPDLDIPHLIDFIKLFKKLRIQRLSDLMTGKVDVTKGKPQRPNLFCGNFPNAPRSSALGAIALLGAIGKMVKKHDVSDLAFRVLESFKENNFYVFKYGNAQVFKFNHHIIDLAEKSHLRSVIDSMYYVSLYNQEKRKADNIEYQKFDLFASRFLQLFNKPAFKDFLAFRAEYPIELEILFITYFVRMEHINQEIVHSVKELGQWLNSVAYRVAKTEIKGNSEQDKELLRKTKAKVLVELESSIFSCKSADALIAHTIARAGRLSDTDAPTEASLFMEKAVSGELSLEQAKNLLIAFSRLKSTVNKNYTSEEDENPKKVVNIESEEKDSFPDYSNI